MVKISQLALTALLVLSFSTTTTTAFTPSTFLPTTHASLPFTTHLSLSSSNDQPSTLKRLPDSAVEITITATPSQTQRAYDKVLAEVCKELTIPGFRKGSKIPAAVVENNFASRTGDPKGLRVQALNQLLGELVEPAVKEEHGLDPIGQPVLSTKVETLAESFKAGDELEMVVRCDVWPDVAFVESEEEKPYFGLEGTYERKPFAQEKYDKAIFDLRDKYAVLTPMDEGKAMKKGDACMVTMVGFMATADGEKGEPLPDAASGDNVEIILTEGRYMEGLIEGLIGAKVGDTKTIDVSFPERLRDKTLAGKKALFDVTVNSASDRKLPEVNDEFAEIVRTGLTAASLEEELKKAIDEQDAKEFVPARNDALSKALSERVKIDVPDTLITEQAREKYAMMMTEFRDQGMEDSEIKKLITTENFLKYKKVYADGIINDFKAGMAIEEIAKLENIGVPTNEVEEQLANLKMEAEKEGEEFDEKMVRGKVESTLQKRMVFDFLAENANLKVEYTEEEKFDEDMMEQLLEDSVEREKEWAEDAKAKATESTDKTTETVDAEIVTTEKGTNDADAKTETETVDAEIVAAEKGTNDADAKADEAKAETEACADEADLKAKSGAVNVKADEAKAETESCADEAKAETEACADEAKAETEACADEADLKAKAGAVNVKADEAKVEAEANDPKTKYEEKLKARAQAVTANRVQPQPEESEAALAKRYGAMSLEDRAFHILLDLGMVEISPDPIDTDYYAGDDDELCDENVFPEGYVTPNE